MAEIGSGSWPTLMDFAQRSDDDGKIADVVEILNETNEILDDMPFVEGNLPTGHKTTIRSGLPTPTWRKLNYGVQPDKGQTVQVTDTTGMLEAYAEVDKALADLNGNAPAWRLSEERGFIEGMAQEMAATTFYGDTDTDPEKFMGLTPRFNDLSADTGANVIDAKGSGSGSDNASIWLIGFSERTVHGIFPKGSNAGIQMQDKGQVTIEDVDGNGGRMEAYRSHYRWDSGLTVRDWRYIVRIANIDISELNADISSNSADLFDLMAQALERIYSLQGVRPVFYCNRTIRSMLRRQAMNQTNVRYGMEQVGGRMVSYVDEVPVRRVDQLLNTEATVS